MKQVLRQGFKDIVVDEVPVPPVSSHQVLIQTAYSLISAGTETASIHQEGVLKEVAKNPSHLKTVWDAIKEHGPFRTVNDVRAKFSEYSALGYCGAGVVVDCHPTVTDVKVGDRVAYGGEGTGHAENVVIGRKLVARIPEKVPFEHACFATLGSIAMNACRIAEIGIGDTVVVVGMGLVGQLVAQLARIQGAVVIAVDMRAERTALAKRLGSDYEVLAPAAANRIAELTNGRGADRVIIAAAAKSSAPCDLALEVCRDRGRIVVVGAVEMSFHWERMYLKEIQLFMSRAYGPGSYDVGYEKYNQDYPVSYVRWTENRNMEEFLRLISIGRVDVQPLITHVFPLDEAQKAYDTIMDGSSGSLAAVFQYPSSVSLAQDATATPPLRKIEITPSAATSQTLGAALVGAGNLARWAHLPNLKRNRHVNVRAICSRDGVRGKSYGKRFGAAYCSTDYAEVLGDPQIDLVVIVSRNPEHANQSLQALEAGKHVFVEKPMALTETECRSLCQAVETSGKQLTVGFNRRFAAYYMDLKQKLSGRKGPAVINCRVNSPGISGAYWMADPAIGGAILGEACHFVDLIYWLLESAFVQVSAYCLPTNKTEPVGENNMVASFRFADDSIANLTYTTIGSKMGGGERVEVFAPGVTAMTNDFTRLSTYTPQRKNRWRAWPEKGYGHQMDLFISSIREGTAPAVTVYDGARATLGCLRMLESAKTKQPCDISLDALLK
ncbi:MAG: bi-domain-containing oxidoreductase [Planctomycetota bacterium]|nr:bi-domain-containing oxidoreductase [Planctomycetota bacterium]MDA1177709.1 bi-domain-containing oxidoreductase [Planctomycetota bacterium]